MKPKGDADGREAPRDFDADLTRLEAIVGELERGDLGLESSLERYQQGIELLRRCHATLASYRKQVEELSAQADGVLRPYADDPDAGKA